MKLVLSNDSSGWNPRTYNQRDFFIWIPRWRLTTPYDILFRILKNYEHVYYINGCWFRDMAWVIILHIMNRCVCMPCFWFGRLQILLINFPWVLNNPISCYCLQLLFWRRTWLYKRLSSSTLLRWRKFVGQNKVCGMLCSWSPIMELQELVDEEIFHLPFLLLRVSKPEIDFDMLWHIRKKP